MIEAVTDRPQWLQNYKWVIGFLAIVGASYFMTLIIGRVMLVLFAQLFLFILLFRRPVWAMAALIVGQLTLANYMISLSGLQISVILLWSILTLLILTPILMHQGGIKLGNNARRIIIPTVILICIATLANYVNIDPGYVFKYLRTNIVWLVILILLPASIKTEKELKLLAYVALVTVAISAMFGIMQFVIRGGRVSGLAGDPVQLGFDLPLVMLPTLAVYLLRGIDSYKRRFIILLLIMMALALYFTYTRTGIFSLAPGLLLMIILIKGKPRIALLLTSILLSAAFLIYINASPNRYSLGFGEDVSATGRLVLWEAGVNVALDYPVLGIGAGRFTDISPDYILSVNPSLIVQGYGTVLGTYQAHDDFITIWASFGTGALVTYLFIFLGIFRNFLESYRKAPTPFIKSLALGCMCALMAYIVNAASHNIMTSSMLLWVLAGLSIATTKVIRASRLSEEKANA